MGGSPANIAIESSKLGLKTGFIGKVSNDQHGDYQIKRAIAFGHAKININTEGLKAWAKAVREVFLKNLISMITKQLLHQGMRQ